jgi:hypothetical protein
MMVTMMMVPGGKSSRRGHHHKEQRECEKFLHGPNRTTFLEPVEYTNDAASRQLMRRNWAPVFPSKSQSA